MASKPLAARDETVRRALLDYYEAPGKHRLQLRQPAVLFSSVPLVLQLAAERGDTGGGTRLREAANFFIRAAMLYPGADHYAVFGLESRKEPVDLKERYRLVMRLIHPDFAAPGEWPADAAVRVNRAYEVLSSPLQRRAYDEQLAAQRGAAGRAEEAGSAEGRRARLRRVATAAIVAAAALGALLILAPGPRPVNLVQKRPAAPPAAPSPAAAEAPPRPAAAPAPALAALEPAPPLPAPAILLPDPPAQRPMLAVAAAALPATAAPRAPAQPARALAMAIPDGLQRQAAQPSPAVAVIALPPAAPAPERRMPAEPAPEATWAARPASVVAALRPAAAAPPTLSEVQPLLSQILESLESGSSERVLALLDPPARRLPAALALSQQYEGLVQGAAPVRLAHGEFRGEARNGVLHVTALLRLHAGEPPIASPGRRFVVRAEFAVRDGAPKLMGLSSVDN